MTDKLFRGIERDTLELIRHAQSECNAWFEEKSRTNNEKLPNHMTIKPCAYKVFVWWMDPGRRNQISVVMDGYVCMKLGRNKF